MSQERLAADALVDRAYLGDLEQQAKNPTGQLLDQGAETLAVSFGELFIVPEADAQMQDSLWSGRREQSLSLKRSTAT